MQHTAKLKNKKVPKMTMKRTMRSVYVAKRIKHSTANPKIKSVKRASPKLDATQIQHLPIKQENAID
jgi:hypothetical protein